MGFQHMAGITAADQHTEVGIAVFFGRAFEDDARIGQWTY